jgi:hypothetical protein
MRSSVGEGNAGEESYGGPTSESCRHPVRDRNRSRRVVHIEREEPEAHAGFRHAGAAMEYTFTLKYQLAADDRDPSILVERLAEVAMHVNVAKVRRRLTHATDRELATLV